MIADQHGNVVVAGTRDCSLQRRFQKLVEEAPAPFLTDAQRKEIHESAKRICKEAGYYGAGTVEYLVGQDGLISFLEVNTRLQVEHPVTEETAGIDLVLQQFRIANGEKLDITEDPDAPRALVRVPHQRRGRRPRLPARPRPGHQVRAADRPRRAPGLRRGDRFGDRRPVRLHAGQADRHRRHPRRGAGSRRGARWPSSTSRAWPPSSRSTARWSPTRRSSATRTASRCTPAGSRPSGTTRRAVHRRRRRSTRKRPRRGRRSSSRSVADAWRCRCPATWLSATAAAAPRPTGRSARSPRPRKRGAHGAARRPQVTPSPPPCRAPSSRSPSRRASRFRPVTSSWCWRP